MIGFVGKAQVYQIMPQYGYTTFRMNFDSTIQIPTFCGVPKLGSNVTKKGALAFDSCNNRFYFFNPKFQSWDTIKSADASLFVKYTDTAQMLSGYLRKADTIFLSQRIDNRVKYTDTSAMLSPYFEAIDTVNLRRVTSVGLTMPSAFTVTNSPITTSGIIGVTGAGTASQYVRGDGVLGDFPTATTGGGASVSYYLNGSVNKGTFVGNTYYEMSRTAIIGSGTDFTRTNAQGNGYIAQFITDTITNVLIPVGNWNLEFYFSASSGGGTPSFYVELYKYDGTNFTLISSNSTSPELIAFGTTINPYFSALAVPETILSGTDRLALRIYVNTSGRSITLHTENSHLCQVITTFTTGLTAINGLTKQVQYLAVGTSGTDFNISSATDTHTFNLPTASATNRGALSSADWTTFNNKVSPSDTANKWITNVFRKTASDSVFFVRGGTNNFAFRDSTGSALAIGTAITSATAGSVLYAGTGGALRQSNTQFFYDSTNASLNIGTNTNVASAILNLSSTTKGFLRPRLTTTQMNAISTPATGLSVFNTTDSVPYTYRGTRSGWQKNVIYNRNNDVALFNGADQRIMIDTTTNIVAGRSLTVEAGSTIAGGLSAFNTLSQGNRSWYGMGSASNGDIYATVANGNLWKRTGGVGNFATIGGGVKDWRDIAIAPNGDIYATEYNGNIWKSSNGGTTFTSLGLTSRGYYGICVAPNGDIYVAVNSFGSGTSDIYISTDNGTTFTGLGQTARRYAGMAAAPNGDIYVAVENNFLFKRTGGAGNFNTTAGAYAAFDVAVALDGNIYAAALGDNIYKSINEGITFTSMNQTTRNWLGITVSSNGDIYSAVNNGDIYLQSQGTSNLNGGTLVLQSGVGKGTGTSTINFNTGTTLTSGATLQTASTKMTILGNGRVGIGTTSPSSILDVSSTTSAFLPPRMTTAQRDLITPVAGMIIYNSTTNKHQGYNGTTWNDFY